MTGLIRMRDQEIAFSSLFIMTVFNLVLGIFMITGLVPIVYGLSLATFAMTVIVYKTWRLLMGDERPWESRKHYNERTDK